jgi:hypothetical protein
MLRGGLMASLGIDPGIRNIGLALTEGSLIIKTKTADLRGLTLKQALDLVREFAGEGVESCTIERFVAYRDLATSDQERLNILIGSIVGWLYERDRIEASLVRAVDWKTALSHKYYKEGFRNPSTSFDKKFDLALCKFIFGEEPKTDHEADAALLSLYRGHSFKL